MGGPGSLTFQVQESLRTLERFGESKRTAKRARQAQILTETGIEVPLSRIVVPEIYSIKTMTTYLNLIVGFVHWCRTCHKIRYVTQIRMETMATEYLRLQLAKKKPSGWTVRTLLSALNKFPEGVRRRYKCDIGRVDRLSVGVLPARRKKDKRVDREYPPGHARAIIDWVAARRQRRAQLAALVLEVQWTCGLRISEATGLLPRMVDRSAGVLLITDTNITKGGRDREVPLPVPDVLIKRLAPLVDAAVARGPKARVLTVRPHYVRWRVRQACRALGLERRGTHGYRYRFVNDRMVRLLQEGRSKAAAMRKVSEETGHSRPDVIRTYSNLW